jgi:hypothetical protein
MQAVAAQPNGTVLNDSETTVAGITFAGIADPLFTPDKQTHLSGTRHDQELYAAAPPPAPVATPRRLARFTGQGLGEVPGQRCA